MFTKTNNNNTFKDCFMLSKDKFDAHIKIWYEVAGN